MSLQAQLRGSFDCSGVCGEVGTAQPAMQAILSRSYNVSGLILVAVNANSYSFSFSINQPEYNNSQANLNNVVNHIKAILEEWGVFRVSVSVTWSNVSSQTNTGGGNASIYIIRSGDTLSRIAAQFGISVAALLDLNPQITNQNLIYVGQAINVSGTPSHTSVVTHVNPNTGATTVANVLNNNQPPKDTRNWFDKTFFTGAGTLTGVGMASLIVIGAVVVTRVRQ